MRLVIILLIIGFSILIIFLWIYDVTPEGFVKTDEERYRKEVTYDLSIYYSNSILIDILSNYILKKHKINQ